MEISNVSRHLFEETLGLKGKLWFYQLNLTYVGEEDITIQKPDKQMMNKRVEATLRIKFCSYFLSYRIYF